MTSREVSAEHRGDLEVDQLRSCQVLTAKSCTGSVARAAVIGQRYCKDTGVNDEHART